MNAVYFDQALTDEARRQLLFDGQVVVCSPTPSSLALCEFARELSVEAFAPYEPTKAQFEMPVEKYASILAGLKPKFIHHPTCKKLIQSMFVEMGCDLEKTFFDVPRLRTSTSNNYLTSGLAYAFHPHRDTWYSAPQCQINWWLPVYDITPENCLAFHPHYWNRPIRNSSREYNYYRWNEECRTNAAQHLTNDTRKQPKAEEPIELDPQVRVVSKVGSILLFSAANLHSSVPNTSGYTRFSIDFRTVNRDDVTAGAGAPNIDAECTGTTLRDYLCGKNLSRLPEELVRPYDKELPPDDAVLVYDPVMSAKKQFPMDVMSYAYLLAQCA